MSRWLILLPLIALGACGQQSAAGPASQPGVIDLPGGGKRVTLTANYVADLSGQGWDVGAGRITPDPVGSDFHLLVTMVVQLTRGEQPPGFCAKQPTGGGTTFGRVEDIPEDVASCTAWSGAQLGGTLEHRESMWAGQGYLWRDRAGAVTARLLIVDDYVIDADVAVTFDIIGL